jgi:acyl-lipid omega-6 desaturase (Delta-12 desaturase)
LSSRPASREGVEWRHAVEPYLGSDGWRASFQLATTLVPLAAAMWTIHVVHAWSLLLALILVPVVAGLLVRTFVLMHDCAHGSFFASRRVNDLVGVVTGVIAMTPFAQWRRDHALHHASSGDLDRRGHGDVTTLTVREYRGLSSRERLAYRLSRHPVLLLLGGPFYLAYTQRFRSPSAGKGTRQLMSVWGTNVAIVLLLAAMVWLVGWQTVLLAYVLPFYVASMFGVWLFYVQHQFEDAYWKPHDSWDYVEAALRGSSHLVLPAPLRWVTANIGLHHIHHVAPRIPNFRLQECHEANALFQRSPTVTMRSGAAALRLALWDETRGRLVSFREAEVSGGPLSAETSGGPLSAETSGEPLPERQ